MSFESLLKENYTKCTMIDKRTVPDGYGSVTTEWTDGAEFEAAIVLNNSLEARVAKKQGVTDIYTITTDKSINMQYHDVFRREEDGKIFRVTSNGDDNKTPKGAGLNMRQVSAEEWELI